MTLSRAYRLAAGLSTLILARAVDAQVRHEFTAVHMGVQVRIALYAPSEASARAAASAAFARIAELDDKMSDYRPYSEVRMLSQHPGDWQPVSQDLLNVLAKAEEVSRQSGGAFDVTVGPLVQLWRTSRRTRGLPDPAALAAARSRSGAPLLELDTDRAMVRLWVKGMQIDLGGIAKGYILQEGLSVLRSRGITAGDGRGGRRHRCGRRAAGASRMVGVRGWRRHRGTASCSSPRERRRSHVRRYGAIRGDQRRPLLARDRSAHGAGRDGQAPGDGDRRRRYAGRCGGDGAECLGPARSSYFRSRFPSVLVSFRSAPETR